MSEAWKPFVPFLHICTTDSCVFITEALRIRINLCPLLFYFFSLYFGLLAVLRSPLEPLGAQTHVDLVFGGSAHAHCFPEESASVAFFESVHDLFTA